MSLTLLLAALTAAAPAAASSVEIRTSVLAETRVPAADGTTRVELKPAARVTPGDRIVFRVEYRNTGAQPANGLVIANPVPAAMLYAGPAEGSPAPELSVDGRTFGPLAALKVGTRPAVAADVRVVRWHLTQPLAAGSHGQVAFRAVIK